MIDSENKHKRKSAIYTTIILVVLISLMFNFGMKYYDPPIEYGVAVNFGNSDVGNGPPVKDVLAPAKTEEVQEEISEDTTEEEVQEEQQEEVEKQKPVDNDSAEDVIVDETNSDAPQVNKSDKEKDKKKTEDKKVEKTQAEVKEKVEKKKPVEKAKPKSKVSDAAKKALQGLLGNSDKGSVNGEGGDKKNGVKGKSTGNPNSSNYYGSGSKGSGGNYQLSGRNALAKPKQNPDCDEEGKVVVQVFVNKQGLVVKANSCIKGTTNSNPCLCKAAKKAALRTKWNADQNAPSMQRGKIIYRFSLSK